MATIFSRIINEELPGRFVYRSDDVVAFLTIEPIKEGHTLVIPVREVDHWIDLELSEMTRVMEVAQLVGRAIDAVYEPEKVAMIIAGLEVPHAHVHLIPIDAESDMRFSNAAPGDPQVLDRVAELLSSAVERINRL